GQNSLHRARREVEATVFRVGLIGGPVHGDDVAAAGFGHKAHARARAVRAAGPADSAFHAVSFTLGSSSRFSRRRRQGGRGTIIAAAVYCIATSHRIMDAALTPFDYLKKILTARVYDVAIESALQPAKALSRRLHNK